MNAVLAVGRELLGLFVDDGALALGVVLVVLAALALSLSGWLAPEFRGFALFVALVAVLAQNILRRARR
jgi:hypothetical protein